MSEDNDNPASEWLTQADFQIGGESTYVGFCHAKARMKEKHGTPAEFEQRIRAECSKTAQEICDEVYVKKLAELEQQLAATQAENEELKRKVAEAVFGTTFGPVNEPRKAWIPFSILEDELKELGITPELLEGQDDE